MKRSGTKSLVGVLAVVLTALIWSIVAGNSVLLGLDLEGGAEVVLEPAADTELEGAELDQAIDQSVSIIRSRVDGLGVAEPDITRQGNRIVVQLPGVDDQQRALEVVGQTAELRFRPVCAVLPAEVVELDEEAEDPASGEDGGDPATGEDGGDPATGEDGGDATATPTVPDQPFGISPADADPTATPEVAATPDAAGDDAAADDAGADDAAADDAAADDAGADDAAADDAAAEDGEGAAENGSDDAPVPGAEGCEDIGIGQIEALGMPTTSREDDDPDVAVILPEIGGDDGETVVARYLLGRTMLTGSALQSADASFDGQQWLVRPTFRRGAEGIDLFNAAAAACNTLTPACPSQQLGIVLDGVVESAPTVQVPFFERDGITITGNYTQAEAEDAALVLKFGALPLEFGDPTDPESGSRVRLVSATLGKDSLEAGVLAGIVGLILVALYMIAYYRLLGVAAITSLAVSGSMLWVILSFLSERNGLALTLAGVVGLVVSIGTSLDTNVVYFEHLKEDIANGRTLRSSVDRSFPVAFKTIVFANSASIIGAAILYWLTVGSVRGFALMLGLASILDLVATYFFLRPLVRLMARGKTLVERPGLYGLPHPPDLKGTAG